MKIAPPETSFKGRKILVVEDRFLVAQEVEALLRGLGCVPVGPAASISQARKFLRDQKIDAAILDVNLGTELVFPLADELDQMGIPFIFASGYDGEASFPPRYEDVGRLPKPLTLRELLPFLSATLDDE